MKILVTIGSMSEKKFTRLFKIIDKLCEDNILNGEDVIAQVGFDDYKSKYYKTFDMISNEEFNKIIDDVDLIITHAGTGTVINCIKKGKKVIIFPRLAKYDEHYDDHQLELAELFNKQKYVLVANNYKELKNSITKISEFKPKKFISERKIENIIINYIERN